MFILKKLEKREQAKAAIQSKHTINELVKQQNTMRYQIGFLVLKFFSCDFYFCLFVFFTSAADVEAKSTFKP